MIYDVAVIGAGVVGGFIARELSRYDLKICLLEREADIACGASSANSGIIHAGYDAEPGSLKAKLNVLGNGRMEKVARELSIPFKRIGSLVLAFQEEDLVKIRALYEKGLRNGVQSMEFLTGEQVREMEPNISAGASGALYAKTAGIVCPYEMTAGAVENAAANGAELKLECEVKAVRVPDEGVPRVFSLVTSKGEIMSRYIVNAAGLYADSIASMVEEKFFAIKPRKGEYLLLDKNQGGKVNRVVFQTPVKMGKGILVTPTVDGNLLIGPNATEVEDKEDWSTTAFGLDQVVAGALKSVPSINVKEVVTSFAGLRAVSSTGDFIIGESKNVRGFINAAGIESPGLTSAPAIGEYVADILRDSGLALVDKKNFNPIRKPVFKFREADDAKRECFIKQDKAYGRIVCRCETITEGEIADCIRRPAGARCLDGVKRRTRAGMGRCQGGFCTPRVAEILSRELGIPMEEVTKCGGNSRLLIGRTK